MAEPQSKIRAVFEIMAPGSKEPELESLTPAQLAENIRVALNYYENLPTSAIPPAITQVTDELAAMAIQRDPGMANQLPPRELALLELKTIAAPGSGDPTQPPPLGWE